MDQQFKIFDSKEKKTSNQWTQEEKQKIQVRINELKENIDWMKEKIEEYKDILDPNIQFFLPITHNDGSLSFTRVTINGLNKGIEGHEERLKTLDKILNKQEVPDEELNFLCKVPGIEKCDLIKNYNTNKISNGL